MLQLILYWPHPRDLLRSPPHICCLPPEMNIEKSRGGMGGHIRSLPSILLIKLELHCGRFASLAQSSISFHKISARSNIGPHTLIMAKGHNLKLSITVN